MQTPTRLKKSGGLTGAGFYLLENKRYRTFKIQLIKMVNQESRMVQRDLTFFSKYS